MVPKMGPKGLDDVCYYIVFVYCYYILIILLLLYIYIVWLDHINTYIHVFISSLYVTIDLIYNNIIFHWG